MHVAIFHPARLPVTRYGGTERVVVWLATTLIRLGINVTLIAGRGSHVPGPRLVEIDIRKGNRHDFDLTPFLPPDADIAHYFVPIHRPPSIPHLWTLQGNPRHGIPAFHRCVFVSRNHAARHGSGTYVYNGLDPTEYEFRDVKDDYVLFLGRLHHVKGWKTAVSIARGARKRIIVAGGFRPSFSRRVHFAGKVGGRRKTSLLAGARALLMPVQWDEPFGLVAVEAMLSGTPVLGTPRGALPELVTPEAGLLSISRDELRAALENDTRWDHTAVRRRGLEFTAERMARAYIEHYESLLNNGTLASSTAT